MSISRRQFISSSLSSAAVAALPFSSTCLAGTKSLFGDGELIVLSDGKLSLPSELVLPNTIDKSEMDVFLQRHGLNTARFEPDCNLALWQSGNRLVLFDVGSGSHFMPTAGKLFNDLQAMNIDAEAVTDVVFTHAHPDHIWGLLDDFDDLAFPNAEYHMNATEWDYWWDENTINTLPEVRQSFAVGARNRLAYLEELINLFAYGEEVLPNIEAVDTHGHTPGHTSFVLHQGRDSIAVLGDALTHPVISFQKANWPSGSDQDQEAGRLSRLSLLDRLSLDKTRILGFHLPHPGIGLVESQGSAYRYIVE